MSFLYKTNKINFNTIYFDALEKVKKTNEYKLNQQRINVIRRVIYNHSDVPKDLIEILIESVEENVAFEYESSYPSFFY